MKTIHLAQPNHRFGNNAFLPYSVASLWAYAIQDEMVRDNFELARPMQFDREPFENIIKAKPDILALSCYIWNWEYNLALAAAVKRDNPKCVVILGGPQVTSEPPDFIDIAIMGEGEKIFHSALVDIPTRPVTFCNGRSKDISQLPSPYLTGLFDDLIEANPEVDFHALWETHRGCPYSCTFCDWGSAVQAKVTQFDMERLKAEMIWFSDNQIELIYNCDANFGMLPRDGELIEWLITTKENTGWPQKLRAAYPKIHTDRIFEQACRLNDSGLGKGVTLSLQSLDDNTLTAIKRKNIAINDYAALSRRYAERGVPTYTELIIGLPGETWESFIGGIDRILDADPNANLAIYPCIVLPNSELNDPAYREKHQIETLTMQQMLLHATPDEWAKETYEVVTSTSTMSLDEWRSAMILSHAIQAFHCTGLTRGLAIFAKLTFGIPYTRFYWAMASHPDLSTLVGMIFYKYGKVFAEALAGGSWDQVMPGYGDISWPAEEASYIRAMENPDLFVAEVCHMVELPSSVIGHQLKSIKPIWPDKEAWAREAVWYGRKASYEQFENARLGDIAGDAR